MATTETRQKRISRSITIAQHHLLASTADLQPRRPTIASHQRLHLHLREPVPSPPVTVALHPYTSAHQIGKEDTLHLQSPSSRCQLQHHCTCSISAVTVADRSSHEPATLRRNQQPRTCNHRELCRCHHHVFSRQRRNKP